MPVMQPRGFDAFERAEQVVDNLARLVRRQSAVAQHFGERLVEGLNHRVNQRFVLQAASAGAADDEKVRMLNTRRCLETRLYAVLVVQRLEYAEHSRLSFWVFDGEPCGAAFTAQQLVQCQPVQRLSFDLVPKRHVRSSP